MWFFEAVVVSELCRCFCIYAKQLFELWIVHLSNSETFLSFMTLLWKKYLQSEISNRLQKCRKSFAITESNIFRNCGNLFQRSNFCSCRRYLTWNISMVMTSMMRKQNPTVKSCRKVVMTKMMMMVLVMDWTILITMMRAMMMKRILTLVWIICRAPPWCRYLCSMFCFLHMLKEFLLMGECEKYFYFPFPCWEIEIIPRLKLI